MTQKYSKDQIEKTEIRFAVHIPRTSYREDAHYIKEQITLKDGTVVPRTYLVKDYKRPVWVTLKSKRNHKDKKEFEHKDNLMKADCTQSDLDTTVANLLGTPHLANNSKELKASPYVYGYDQTSTSIIKLKSLIKNKGVQSPYTVAFFDIETDTTTQEIIIATIAYKNRIYTRVSKNWAGRVSNLENRVKQAIELYLPKYKDSPLDFKVCNTEPELIESIFKVAHTLKPDFLAIWNMDFDIPKVLERLDYHGKNPVDYLADPEIPRPYRICRYKQGIKKKVTASGVVKPINPALQWHTLILTASFYVIDAMCVYRQLRMATQEEPTNLNYILQKELGSRKLNFDVADRYSGLKWHIFMANGYPVEYIVYNIYDTLGMSELDDKIKDLRTTLPTFAGMTDFNKFNSNPKKIVDALFQFGLEKSLVIGVGSKANKKEEQEDEDVPIDNQEEDNDTLDLKGWIQLLPQNQLLHEGLTCLEEYPNVVTNIRGMVIDMDSVSSYPTCTEVGNVSKETCSTEIVDIIGVKEEVFRLQNISLLLGGSNTLDYFSTMFDLPRLDRIDELVQKYI
jgi:hypothetical protein